MVLLLAAAIKELSCSSAKSWLHKDQVTAFKGVILVERRYMGDSTERGQHSSLHPVKYKLGLMLQYKMS